MNHASIKSHTPETNAYDPGFGQPVASIPENTYVLARMEDIKSDAFATPISRADLIAGATFSIERVTDLITRQRITPNLGLRRIKGLSDFIRSLTDQLE